MKKETEESKIDEEKAIEIIPYTENLYGSKKNYGTTSITCNESETGERIEDKVERIMFAGEAINDSAQLVYNSREDGIDAATNIRTDKWDLALDAMSEIGRRTELERTEAVRNNMSVVKENEVKENEVKNNEKEVQNE